MHFMHVLFFSKFQCTQKQPMLLTNFCSPREKLQTKKTPSVKFASYLVGKVLKETKYLLLFFFNVRRKWIQVTSYCHSLVGIHSSVHG